MTGNRLPSVADKLAIVDEVQAGHDDSVGGNHECTRRNSEFSSGLMSSYSRDRADGIHKSRPNERPKFTIADVSLTL